LLFKEFKLISFDSGFARGLGFSVATLEQLLLWLVTIAVVVGIQAVGVVLVAALLITPAVSARYWTDRLGVMTILSGIFGALSGAIGTWISAGTASLPTGPLSVLTATAVFVGSVLIGPRRGILAKLIRRNKAKRDWAAESEGKTERRPPRKKGRCRHERFLDYAYRSIGRFLLRHPRVFPYFAPDGARGRRDQPLGIAWYRYRLPDQRFKRFLLHAVRSAIIGFVTVFLIQMFQNSGVQSDASIGVVFTSLFAAGVLLVSLNAKHVDLDLDCVLYGEIAYVQWNQISIAGMEIGPKAVWLLGITLFIIVAIIALFYKQFKLCAFDPALAAAIGIPVALFHYVLMGLVSMATVSSFESVGAILVVGLLIVPPRRLTS